MTILPEQQLFQLNNLYRKGTLSRLEEEEMLELETLILHQVNRACAEEHLSPKELTGLLKRAFNQLDIALLVSLLRAPEHLFEGDETRRILISGAQDLLSRARECTSDNYEGRLLSTCEMVFDALLLIERNNSVIPVVNSIGVWANDDVDNDVLQSLLIKSLAALPKNSKSILMLESLLKNAPKMLLSDLKSAIISLR